MISRVKITNLARWKGTHEIKYPEGINILDGKFGAGKSSLLVDAFQIVFTNSCRTSLENIVTKGETYASIELDYTTPKGKKYRLLWEYTPKQTTEKLDKKSNTLKESSVPAKTVWDTFEWNEDQEQYIKSFSTPEQILGIPYSVASKTFIIQQLDIDAFSKIGPTEKYDIIASSFNIDSLFKIGSESIEVSKQLTSQKSILLKDLDSVNVTDFDNLESLKKETDEKKSDAEKIVKKIQGYQTEKENTNKLLATYQNIDYLELKKNQDTENLGKLKEVNLVLHNEEILKLQTEIKSQDVSKIKELETSIGVLSSKKSHTIEMHTTQVQQLSMQDKMELQNTSNELQQVATEFQRYKVTNTERFTPEYIKTLEEKDVSIIPVVIEGIVLEQSKKTQELNLLNYEKTQLLNIIKQVTQLQDHSCPTCHRELSETDKNHIIKTYQDNIIVLDEKIQSTVDSLSVLDKNLVMNRQTLLDSEDLQKWKVLQELSKKGMDLQEKYKKLKETQDKKLTELREKQQKELSEIDSESIVLYTQLEKLKEKSTVKSLQEKLDQLLYKTWNIGTKTYTSVEIQSTIPLLEQNIKDVEKELKGLSDSIQGKTKEFLLNYIVEMDQRISEQQSQLQVVQNEIYHLGIKFATLETLKNKYELVKTELEILNKKLDKLEKISTIFGKKGQPKLIIEQIIVPQLEKKTNEILNDITEGRYTIEFVLTTFTNEGRESKKNTFDINVVQEGIRQNYDSLSGGEKMNINYAIRLGITSCLNELLGYQISDFLILDESFNSIDSDASEQQILSSIKKTSEYYKQMFIITHVDELKEGLVNMATVHSIVKQSKYSNLLGQI